ncbi:MAG: hypothetical protein ACXVC6_10095 [Bacteroidia bacterium]
MKFNKFQIAVYFILLLVITGLSSCSVVKGIFDAGMVWGILLVVGVIGLIVYLVSRIGKDK